MSDAAVAKVNGVALHAPDERLAAVELRQRACVELLRQAAMHAGIEAAKPSDAIERWLDRALVVDEPSDAACRRYHEAHAALAREDERLMLRHILFAVTPGVDLAALRARAEALLFELRAASPADGDAFAEAARRWSNCPSSVAGGALGSLARRDCAEEFARDVFGRETVGVLPELVRSRFGFHVVEIVARDPGRPRAFAEVEQAVRQSLRQQAWATALAKLVQRLAHQATIEGVRLDGGDTAAG